MTVTADAIVIGAGVIGAAAALEHASVTMRPPQVRPRIAARPANIVAASTSTPRTPAISAVTRRASASTAAREKSGCPSDAPVR